MITGKEILEALRKEFYSGKKYNDIAKETGFAQSYLCDLVNGKKSFESLSIRKLNQLFPKCKISLYGDVNQNIKNNTGTNYQIVGEKNFIDNKSAAVSVLDKLLNQIMENEKFPAEIKVELFNIIKSIKE